MSTVSLPGGSGSGNNFPREDPVNVPNYYSSSDRSGTVHLHGCQLQHISIHIKYYQSATSGPLDQRRVKICPVFSGPLKPQNWPGFWDHWTVIERQAPTTTKLKGIRGREGARGKTRPLPPGWHMWSASGDRNESLVWGLAWRHCPLTLCCLPAGLLWTFAIGGTLSKAQTSAAVAQFGKTALHALVGWKVRATAVQPRCTCEYSVLLKSRFPPKTGEKFHFFGEEKQLNHSLSPVQSIWGGF